MSSLTIVEYLDVTGTTLVTEFLKLINKLIAAIRNTKDMKMRKQLS